MWRTLMQEHWFTIRRIYGEFWNFNSLFPAPQPLSLFYLGAFLATLKEQGYTIFVVRGQLSLQQNEDAGHPDSHGAWFTPEQVNIPAADEDWWCVVRSPSACAIVKLAKLRLYAEYVV